MALRLFDNEHYLRLESVNEGQLLDHVPPHVYRIALLKEGMGETPILMKDRKRFEVGERRYGDFQKRFQRMTEHYDPTMPSTGAILLGLKGSGKSLLAEVVCNWALSRDLPVLLVDKAMPASLILTFVKLIGPCVVYFDEFGKIYPLEHDERPDQTDMLGYFSDTSTRGVVNIVTANEQGELLDYFYNRPQRFRFLMRYTTLSIDDVDEIANEHRLGEWRRTQMHRMAVAHGLSWDMARDIAAVLRDCRNEEEAKDQLQFLNVPGWISMGVAIDEVFYRGEEVITDCIIARYLDERFLQIKILDEETGEVLEQVEIDTHDTAMMGESKDCHGEEDRLSRWMDMDRPGTKESDAGIAKGVRRETAAGRCLYPFVRPTPNLRLRVTTRFVQEGLNATQVGIGGTSRWARNQLRAEEEKRKAQASNAAVKEAAVDDRPLEAAGAKGWTTMPNKPVIDLSEVGAVLAEAAAVSLSSPTTGDSSIHETQATGAALNFASIAHRIK